MNKYLIWIRSAGRCQYIGCNKELHTDILTKKRFNQSYIAHIVADQPNGPRGDVIRSPQLADDIDNLMLLCDSHHRLIDKIEVDAHSEPILLAMKRDHELRIQNVTSIHPDRKSFIVSYNANIGANTPNVSYLYVSNFLLPDYFPAQDSSIELGVVNSLNKDSDPDFWEIEIKNLKQKFDRFLLPRIKSGEINHISLFGFAPIPLLIHLGVLLNDILIVDVRQKRRVPDTWAFDSEIETDYIYEEKIRNANLIALKIELSGDITDDRIEKVMGNDVSIYSVRIADPHNDFVKSRKQIKDFGNKLKYVLNDLKKKYGQDMIIHLFPAMPVALAVEFGRVWMPKADMTVKIYDQNAALGGFCEALYLKHE
ncbi:HNH endonuclease [Sphingobacterium paucimobilis]|uniref:SMODS-associated and fused to various effectors domain-containing protein n=1 Tax=Sphingobacterium paucimobilis HER1398 TaxID=1346330 RepID=U2J3X4_9SPHI|nr:HNH endonuclease [Sphingobacterium paucimobilis]ERJ57348.1 hypothetical protein M472_01075 [Sphingobacterium paucimobilis HER1398]